MTQFSIRKRIIPMTPSKLAMWRCAIALVLIDSNISNSELDFIHNYSAAFDFSDEQEKILDDDIRNPVDFYSLYPLVTERADRTHLINFALALFYADGDYSKQEQDFYDNFHNSLMKEIDVKKVLANAKSQTVVNSLQLDKDLADKKYKMSLLERVFYNLSIAWDDE